MLGEDSDNAHSPNSPERADDWPMEGEGAKLPRKFRGSLFLGWSQPRSRCPSSPPGPHGGNK